MPRDVEGIVTAAKAMFDLFKIVGKEGEVTKAEHHPDSRRQVQEVFVHDTLLFNEVMMNKKTYYLQMG